MVKPINDEEIVKVAVQIVNMIGKFDYMAESIATLYLAMRIYGKEIEAAGHDSAMKEKLSLTAEQISEAIFDQMIAIGRSNNGVEIVIIREDDEKPN